MAFENERKFLLKNDDWKKSVNKTEEIEQGYVDLSKVIIKTRANKLIITTSTLTIRKNITEEESILLDKNLHREEKVLRIRIKGEKLILTLKIDIGVVGSQIEVEPLEGLTEKEYNDLKALCDSFIEKTRHEVPIENYVFEIDIFKGKHLGLKLAEVETPSLGETVPLPDWLGEEVTGNHAYSNSTLARS